VCRDWARQACCGGVMAEVVRAAGPSFKKTNKLNEMKPNLT